jgi:hypothetical protein
MRRLIPALIAAAALAAPATASAHSATCGRPFLYVTVHAANVPCATAMAVYRYWDSHETLFARTVRIAGRAWTITVNRNAGTVRAYGQRLPRYVTYLTASGGRLIEVDSLPYG